MFMNVAVPVAVAAARLMLNLKRLILELFVGILICTRCGSVHWRIGYKLSGCHIYDLFC